MKRIGITWLAVLLCSGCGGGTSLEGDGARDDASADAADEAAGEDAAVETTDDAGVDDADDVPPDGSCCAPPMALDPSSGTCVSTEGIHAECAGSVDACGFGQLCVQEWGEGPLGEFCHIPCELTGSMLCPAGYYCLPPRCCDIPGLGCVPDPCSPPLVGHPGTESCVSIEGLGGDCSTGESCGVGQECTHWVDIAAGEHWTCEVRCAGNPPLCPNGFVCTSISDGPSDVCERRIDERGCDDPGAQVCGQAEKFMGGLTRDFVCRGCYGVFLCADLSSDGSLGLLQTLAPGIDCSATGVPYDCGTGLTACLLAFRSGISDCFDGRPSDFFWTSTCLAANTDAVRSVHCYYLE
jgi:hypothetical protein